MKKLGCMVLISTLSILVFSGFFLTPYAKGDEYAVGGEIIPFNPWPFHLNPALLAALTIILVFIAASIFVKGFPIKITIET